MTVSHFAKTWGAEPLDDDRWRFALWAPTQGEATLVLGSERLGLDRDGEGWFRTEVRARPDTPYAFEIAGLTVPDPAARAQAEDVHGPSRLVDPRAYDWHARWSGRPWHETVLYELHTGTFSPEGTFDGVRARLDHLASIGVTAIELCPVAQFGGQRGWGYDGVLPYAAHTAYGGPEALKRLVDAIHERGLMAFLDVVYNHFGPDGGYLHAYAPDFFHEEWRTPWGPGIAFDRDPVRRFFVENALYWLDEYRFDGLRLDAVDTISDPSEPELLVELAEAVRAHGFDRPVHLTTEDDRNITRLHERDETGRVRLYDGEWNDDYHHVAHVLATGEREGYYGDHAEDPRGDLVTALASGYVQQGIVSPHRDGVVRGEPSAHLPPVAFVNFLQNHDQTGNRAFGERLTALAEPRAVEVLTALTLLSPFVPLVFMGEEWGETNPFLFFCDFHGELAQAVRDGRRREFAKWSAFADPAARDRIPDPNARETFFASKLDWSKREVPEHRERLEFVRALLAIRHAEIVPRLAAVRSLERAEVEPLGERGIRADWPMDGARLRMVATLGGSAPGAEAPGGRALFALGDLGRDPWAIAVALEETR